MDFMEGEFRRKMADIEERERIQQEKAKEKENIELSIRKDVDQLKAHMDQLLKGNNNDHFNEQANIKSINKQMKRPARLLPISVLKKYALLSLFIIRSAISTLSIIYIT